MEKVKKLINKRYKPEYGSYTQMRSMGNYDDVFSDGYTSGYNSALYEIGIMLGMELEPLEEIDMDDFY